MSTAARVHGWLSPVLVGVWCVMACGVALRAQESDRGERPTVPKLTDVDSDLMRLVVEDQWDRGMDMFGGRPAAGVRDAVHQRRCERLDDGAVRR